MLRAPMHAWKNPSKTEVAKMAFVMVGSAEVKVGEKEFPEDFSKFTA